MNLALVFPKRDWLVHHRPRPQKLGCHLTTRMDAFFDCLIEVSQQSISLSDSGLNVQTSKEDLPPDTAHKKLLREIFPLQFEKDLIFFLAPKQKTSIESSLLQPLTERNLTFQTEIWDLFRPHFRDLFGTIQSGLQRRCPLKGAG